MSAWPWLGAGWMQHCHAGQFPPARFVSDDTCAVFGWPTICLLRPMRLADMRLPPLKWPSDPHPEKSRLYAARRAVVDAVVIEPDLDEEFAP